MIRFRAFDGGKKLQATLLRGAHLFGQDEIPVRTQLEMVDGELIGVRHSDTAVGLTTMWNVEGFGQVMLQTTRLPEREQAYNLNVEIARGRLLRISQKREEWGMTDLQLSAENHQLVDAALEKFIEALSDIDQSEKAAGWADESLLLALQAGEAMALAHAQLFLQRRNSTQGFGRHSFGCYLDPGRIQDTEYLKLIKDNFHFVTVPVSWRQLEPKEQENDFEVLDECVNWLARNRIAAKVGPLLNFTPTAVPDWLYIWENDFEQVREMAYDYITRLVERYGPKVQAWDVISGLNAENCFKFSFDQIIEMTRTAALAAKRAAPRSLMLVEIAEPWGQYYAHNQRTIPPFIYADMVCQSGASFDGFGIKLHFGRGAGGMRTRDLLELSCLLDRFGLFGKPVHLAGVQVPSKTDARENGSKGGQAGWWHEPWTPDVQAQWLDQAYQIALSKPYVETVSWQDLIDCDDEGLLQHGGLFDAQRKAKPAFERLCQLKTKLLRAEPGKTARGKTARTKAKPAS